MNSKDNSTIDASQARVYIVDDDDAMRDALCVLMRSVKLPVESYPSGVDFLQSCQPGLRGCMLLDVRMPGLSGFDLIERLRAASVTLPIVLISAHGDIRQAVKAMHRGAFDFIEKPFDDQELLDLVFRALKRDQEVQRHETWLRESKARLNELTERETTILKLVASGLHNKEIASELEISIRTVENHRARVMDKLQARSVADVVRVAMALRIIDWQPARDSA